MSKPKRLYGTGGSMKIGNVCSESSPCEHEVEIWLNEDLAEEIGVKKHQKQLMCSVSIWNLARALGIKKSTLPPHFQ